MRPLMVKKLPPTANNRTHLTPKSEERKEVLIVSLTQTYHILASLDKQASILIQNQIRLIIFGFFLPNSAYSSFQKQL